MQDAEQDLALVGLGTGQGEGDRQPVQGADQVQAQPPEVAAVAGAVAVLGPAGQLGAVDGLGGPAAFHRGGVTDPHVVGPQRGVTGQHAHDPLQEIGRGAQALVVAGLLGQVGKQVTQVGVGVTQPTGVGGEPEQGLHDCQGDQFAIRQLGCDADRGTPRGQMRGTLQQVIDGDEQCGGEGVQVGVHEGPPRLDVGVKRRSWTPFSILACSHASP